MINRTEARYSEIPSRAPINRILPSGIPRQVTFSFVVAGVRMHCWKCTEVSASFFLND